MENETPLAVERVETVPEGAQAMKLVQGPDGTFYLVPQTSGAGGALNPAGVDPAATAGPGLFDWAEPIMADPLGWAEANLLSFDILLPIAYQVGAIVGVLLIGAMLAPRLRALIGMGVQRAA